MTSYTEILAKAREHDLTVAKRMRGWAVEVHNDKAVLVSYWYNKNRDVSAHALYVDGTGDAQLELIAAHLNECIGAGALTIEAFQTLHRKNAKTAEGRKVAAEVIKMTTWSIN